MKAILTSVLFISLLISVGRPLSAVGAGHQGTRPPAPARASTTQRPADGGSPRAYVTPSGAGPVINEPQIGRWLDQKRRATYAAVPCTTLGAQHAGTAAAAPTVLVSQNPTELMLLNGAAAYTPVMGTRLERVSNTDSNVFRSGTAGTVYYRVSGCWFSAPCVTRRYAARYSPWTRAYTRAGAVYGPCDEASYAARYNPRTGIGARGAAAWGPGGARGTAEACRDQCARTARVTNRATRASTRMAGTSGDGGAVSRSVA
jgi:hypothetical protein